MTEMHLGLEVKYGFAIVNLGSDIGLVRLMLRAACMVSGAAASFSSWCEERQHARNVEH